MRLRHFNANGAKVNLCATAIYLETNYEIRTSSFNHIERIKPTTNKVKIQLLYNKLKSLGGCQWLTALTHLPATLL